MREWVRNKEEERWKGKEIRGGESGEKREERGSKRGSEKWIYKGKEIEREGERG